ncbi:uncharacterized protein K452DRAFT_304295 [Aplosporella prunicola CBS 121167]|uniref:Uncharacterized protein n=1 Tax=Aplosporella prunicola CBS 121167 TaxID=1176127 RepID=A0A6A6BX37_9PEZI|nr:uncharacterized protein K452DRAFT_304295 [Aplosporella prunicola CBS 121167]KAF2147467.1 hypothetical protein K452DRAFT_304295 [Aplosporella prunicola CBS 121167]
MDDMEMDPEMAAVMGFASFGASKKRKFHANDAFVEGQSDAKRPKATGTGANMTEIGARKTSIDGAPQPPDDAPDAEKEDAVTPSHPSLPPKPSASSERPGDLASGFKNENGDMAYFLPSFVEDPWHRLLNTSLRS